jgi:hypothetical protein
MGNGPNRFVLCPNFTQSSSAVQNTWDLLCFLHLMLSVLQVAEESLSVIKICQKVRYSELHGACSKCSVSFPNCCGCHFVAVPEIAMQHFGASLEGTDLQRMTATAEYYSKGRHASPRGHSDDAQLKVWEACICVIIAVSLCISRNQSVHISTQQLKATPEMKKFSAEIADPVYAMLVSASQSQIGS